MHTQTLNSNPLRHTHFIHTNAGCMTHPVSVLHWFHYSNSILRPQRSPRAVAASPVTRQTRHMHPVQEQLWYKAKTVPDRDAAKVRVVSRWVNTRRRNDWAKAARKLHHFYICTEKSLLQISLERVTEQSLRVLDYYLQMGKPYNMYPSKGWQACQISYKGAPTSHAWGHKRQTLDKQQQRQLSWFRK